MSIAKRPPAGCAGLSLESVASRSSYAAKNIKAALQDFVYRCQTATDSPSLDHGTGIHLPFTRIDVWEKVSFQNPSFSGFDDPSRPLHNTVFATPWSQQKDHNGVLQQIPGRQDIVLIRQKDPEAYGIHGMLYTFL